MAPRLEPLQDRTILLVNSGSKKKRFTVRKLKELGLNIILLNKTQNWAHQYVSHWILADTDNHPAALQAVQDFLLSNPEVNIEGVLTFWEDDVLLCSKLRDMLDLPGINYEIARTARDKYLFRDFCARCSLPAPRYALIRPEKALEDTVKDFRFPVVVKPVFGTSSAYVVKAHNLEELQDTVQYIRQTISPATESALTAGLDVMMEEYIDGNEVDIDILLQNGKIKFWSISDNDATNEPYFVETGQCIPSRLSPAKQTELLEMAEETLERLGITDGCIHFEAKYSSSGPVPIEINLRMGGDEVYAFVKTAWGTDLIEGAVRIALGLYLPKKNKSFEPKRYLVGKYFLPSYSGVLASLKHPQTVDSGEIHFFKKVGDVILTPPLGYEYLGWVYAADDTPSRAAERVNKIIEQCSIEIARFSKYSSVGQTSRRNSLSSAYRLKKAVLGAAKVESLRSLPLAELRSLHVGIASNMFLGSDNPIESELTSDAQIIAHELSERGYRTTFLDFNEPFHAVEQIQREHINIVFNLCERINHSSLLEPHAAALFDILGVPYTGSNPFTLGLCLDKIRSKKLLAFHRLPTPRWDYLYDSEDAYDEDFPLPAIVKPSNSDSSLGITNESVVTTKRQLMERVRYVLEDLQRPVLIEEFIEGDEYDVSILGNATGQERVLPLSRSVFTNLPEGYWHMYPYEAKFLGSKVHKESIEIQRPPRGVPSKILSLISEIALDAYNVFGCSDYGRVEIRVDRKGNPFILEVNPNPSIGPKDCVPQVAALAGLRYGDFLEEILQLTLLRYKNRPPLYHLQMTAM